MALFLMGLAAGTTATLAQPDLFDGFNPGWREHWREQRLFTRPTLYAPVREDGGLVLHASSNAANSGLVREINLKEPTLARLSWRWKVKASLQANSGERTRAGDDYAARVLVVFETSVIPLQTRAINYVWAAHEPAGVVFASPYSSRVAMIVLRSGDREADTWQSEQRDVLTDYRSFFGEPPRTITAVAVMVDTDNTNLAAEARFAKLRLESAPPWEPSIPAP